MLTQARKARSTGRVTLSDSFMQTLKEGILRYLRELDYVSFSLYARINARKPDGSPVNWEGPGSDEDLRAISSAFRAVADGWRSELGSGVVLDIGEFGLGTPDIGSPENDFPDPFLDQNRQMRDSARNMRRNYYRGFLRFLREHSDLFKKENACSTFQPATFWTVKQFDFLGLWNYPIPLTEGGQVPHEIFHDEELGSWIYLWNEETYFHVDDG